MRAPAWAVAGVVVLSAALHLHAQAPMTPVAGPSVLSRLGLTLQQSPMGWTGRLGPSPDGAPPARPRRVLTVLQEATRLTGADLYRINCQACHRAGGTGAAEGIASILEPIRSMSPAIMRRRMMAKGRPISAAFATELAAGSRDDIVKRLRTGGEKMPRFDYLGAAEIDALLAYLEWLAGVPGAGSRQRGIVEPAHRVGEQLVKGTCHICHDATGPWPDRQAMLEGAIPSLAKISSERTIHDVLAKVRYGKPVIMGTMHMSYRGRMPVFEYLTDREVQAAYDYLIAYPPQARISRSGTGPDRD